MPCMPRLRDTQVCTIESRLHLAIVHGASARFTVSFCAGLTTGMLNTHHVYLPIPTVISRARQVNTSGRKWNRLKTSIQQPDLS